MIIWNAHVQIEVRLPRGRIEILDAHRYPNTIREFKDGRGDFFDQETLGPRAIFVKFVISRTRRPLATSNRFSPTTVARRGN
jgi:hypothetical protein